jgi:threonine/homoserine/homoserine lactone efflux protein
MDLRRGRWPGRAGARSAGATALTLLAVTAVLALVLALSFHLAWPPVLVSIVGTLPALYLAWLAVPGTIGRPGSHADKMPTHRRQVRRWNPRRLGVHAAISMPGMPDEVLPEYVPRDVDAAEHGVRAKVAAAVPARRPSP